MDVFQQNVADQINKLCPEASRCTCSVFCQCSCDPQTPTELLKSYSDSLLCLYVEDLQGLFFPLVHSDRAVFVQCLFL